MRGGGGGPGWRPRPFGAENAPGEGPGVPEALPRTIREVGRRLGAGGIDRIWIFPPLIEGRREWGLVAASCYAEGESRRIVTAPYQARRTGKGLFLDWKVREQGTATADRIGRVMDGAARRGPAPLGAPRVVEIGGDEAALAALMATFVEERPGDLFREAVAGAPASAPEPSVPRPGPGGRKR